LDECPLDHAEEIAGALLESRENSAALFQPANETLDDIALPVLLTNEFRAPRGSVFVSFAGDHRADASIEQILIDPVSPLPLITSKCDRRDSDFRFLACDFASFEEFSEARGFVRFSGGDVGMQRIAARVAKNVDFGAKSAARPA
jgi:hypothetical protein